MEGINLSSSLGDNKKKQSFFNGTVIIVSVFFLTLFSWGGMKWYSKLLSDDLIAKTALLEKNSAQLRGSDVDRIVSYNTRFDLIQKQMSDDPSSTEKLLGQLENLVIPNVRLTKYEFNKKDKFVVIEGETNNFKYVAEQLMTFKGESLFSSMIVESLKKNEIGRIVFSFKTTF